MNIDFPFHFDERGRTATTTDANHIRDMIEALLFTSPGERVNLPDFGCGLLQLVFEPNSDTLATATQFLVHGSLQRWLADVIQVDRVDIANEDGQLIVDVVYTRLDTGQRQQDLFFSPAGGT